ncbi:hypothetical protein D3C81_2178110 [compost metagenome]
MPPFLSVRLEALVHHGGFENVPVLALFFGNQLGAMTGNFTEKINPAPHIDFFTGSFVNEGQIDRTAPGMSRFAG